ncbi:MAG: STAS domain-containing protein [Phycisphaerales bacterium]
MPQQDQSIAVKTDVAPGVVVVHPQGDVDMSRSPELRTTIRSVQERRPPKVIIDLTDVEYMDSSGLATLVEAMRTAKSNNTAMILCGMHDKVRSIFEIARLNQFFKIVDNLDAAVSA